jgi:hypothetical protein
MRAQLLRSKHLNNNSLLLELSVNLLADIRPPEALRTGFIGTELLSTVLNRQHTKV